MTKAMLFNFTNNFQFGTRLNLKGENIQVVNEMKILGTIFNNKLTWNENCANIIKRVNGRMQLLRSILAFGASKTEMVHLWKTFCRPILEQSCVVWHGSLTDENITDLERTQKTFCKLVLQRKYENYENALAYLDLEMLTERREKLLITFAKRSIDNKKLHDLFPIKKDIHNMQKRSKDKYQVQFCATERLKKSSILKMTHLLNIEEKSNGKV